MFLRILKSEIIKLRRSPIWIAVLILPFLSALMGTFNFQQNLDILTNGWYSLWTQHTLFLCYFFLPTMIGVYASYLWRLEHSNHNWNIIMTAPIHSKYLYIAKLTILALLILITQIWIGILFFIFGKICGIANTFPLDFIFWSLGGCFASIVIGALQLCFSLVIRSFSIPVGIAFIGGFLGLAAYAKGLGNYFPYSLLGIGMKASDPSGAFSDSVDLFIISGILYLSSCFFFAIIWLNKKDVVTE